MKVRIFLAAIFTAVMMALLPVANATAATGSAPGDEVWLSGTSNGKVVATDNVYGKRDVWRYQGTYVTFGWKDVDYFWVPGGCDAYNIDTGYKYVGNRTYGPMNGSYYLLQLKVVC